ncbi:MAG: VWA domain-containing protein [Anaerolineales bacterium]
MNALLRNLRVLIPVGLALSLLVFPLQTARAQAGGAAIRVTQVDNSKFPLVTLYVSVVDASDEPMPVNPDQIQIYENGQLMKPQEVSGSGEIGPLTTLLVIDTSGSMRYADKLTGAKTAAEAYVDQMRPEDQAGLLSFDTQVTYRQSLTADPNALKKAISGLTTGGDTALFDALMQAVQILQNIPGRKAIILMTDGMDNRSKYTEDNVIQAVGANSLSISTIGLGLPNQTGSISGVDETTLQSLASRAGGIYGYANDSSALSDLFQQYGRNLQSEYRITYTSPLTLRDGLNRTLTVSLGSGASAQARYNPGGVLPEVAQGVSWPTFIILLAGLLLLLFIPGMVSRWSKSALRNEATLKNKPHIKLK